MIRIDFSGLKLKLVSAIIVISGVQLLRAFMDVRNTTDRELFWFTGIHLVFVISAVMLAVPTGFLPMITDTSGAVCLVATGMRLGRSQPHRPRCMIGTQ